jgi:hypothetical protein
MLLVLAFVLGFFLGGITVSLLREEVKKAEKLAGDTAASVPTSPVPESQSVVEKKPSAPAAIVSREGKKMCRATGVVPPSFVTKPTGIPFRCPKCSKTVGRRGPLLTKNALRGHMLKCSG